MLSTSRLLRNSLRMRHILCRQVLLQNGDGGGEMQRGEGPAGGVGEEKKAEFTMRWLCGRQDVMISFQKIFYREETT